ncbi:MAG: hypothetical protein GY749_11400 [Desulfobacteraceae bacterium]|nr:hypothetical protein [Desulfobacteraceae bacterium]
MDKKPTYEELEKKVRILEDEVRMLKQMEKYLFESSQKQAEDKTEFQEDSFASLDEQEISFAIAEKNIDILQGYEYYLSESFPVSNILNNAVSEFPKLESVLELLISNLACSIDKKWTRKQIIEYAIKVLNDEIMEMAIKDNSTTS